MGIIDLTVLEKSMSFLRKPIGSHEMALWVKLRAV